MDARSTMNEFRTTLRRAFPALAIAMVIIGGWCLVTMKAQPETLPQPATQAGTSAVATFAGGCFWCMEPPFDALPGVFSTTSGYIGGKKANPTYDQVSAGSTGHAEAVQVRFDPERISYQQLLDVFWRNIDPVTPNRQFCDAGSQYRSAIFYHDAAQQELAQRSKASLEESNRLGAPIVTQIVAATAFYPAEEYHQDYATRNPLRYKFYRTGCGRDQRLHQLWD